MKIKHIDEYGRVKEIETEVVIGGSLMGEVDCGYSQLKSIFGTPAEGDGYKTEAEWTVSTPVGIACIYDYKEGKSYNGAEGTAKTKIRDWHIGGDNKNVVAYIMLAIAMNTLSTLKK